MNYVEDRDLWLFRLPDSSAINAYLGVLPFDFEGWTRASELEFERTKELGYVVLAKVEQYVSEVSKNARLIKLDGHVVPAVNASPVDVSDLLEHVAVGHPFALSWSVRFDGVFRYSLRSTAEGVDVSAIAKAHGGGGHKHAAGFESRVPLAGLFGR